MPPSLRIFSLTLLIGLLLTAGFVYWEDPASLFRRQIPFTGKAIAEDEVWVGPAPNFPERDIRRKQIQVQRRPDLTVLGSSRVLLIRSSWFKPGITFQNLGLSGATLEDDIALWQVLKTSHKVPEFVLLGIDPWILNENNGQYRWKALENDYHAFFAPHRASRFVRGEMTVAETLDTLSRPVVNLGELWSWSSVQASWELAFSTISKTAIASVYKETSKPTSFSGYHADGSFVYPDHELAKRSLAAIEAAARDYALTGEVYSLSNWKTSQRALAELDLLLRDMSLQGTHALVFISPYQPLARKLINQRAAYANVLTESGQLLEKAVAHVPEIDYCNAEDAATIGCSADEFMDGMHMSSACAEKMVQYCCRKSVLWRPLLKTPS